MPAGTWWTLGTRRPSSQPAQFGAATPQAQELSLSQSAEVVGSFESHPEAHFTQEAGLFLFSWGRRWEIDTQSGVWETGLGGSPHYPGWIPSPRVLGLNAMLSEYRASQICKCSPPAGLEFEGQGGLLRGPASFVTRVAPVPLIDGGGGTWRLVT